MGPLSVSHELINRSPDLARLRDDGYELDIRAGHLIVSHVPYVMPQKTIGFADLVSTLTLAGDVTVVPDTHVAMFTGEQYPCDQAGAPLLKLFYQSARREIAPGLVINHTFSAKPQGGYPNYYEKMTTYIAHISGPAEALNPSVSARCRAGIEATNG